MTYITETIGTALGENGLAGMKEIHGMKKISGIRIENREE